MAVLSGHVDRAGFVESVLDVDVRPTLDEELDDIDVALVGGGYERGCSVAVAGVDVGPLVERPGDARKVAGARGVEQLVVERALPGGLRRRLVRGGLRTEAQGDCEQKGQSDHDGRRISGCRQKQTETRESSKKRTSNQPGPIQQHDVTGATFRTGELGVLDIRAWRRRMTPVRVDVIPVRTSRPAPCRLTPRALAR